MGGVLPWFGFVGYFGAAPFGATLIIDQNRIGHPIAEKAARTGTGRAVSRSYCLFSHLRSPSR